MKYQDHRCSDNCANYQLVPKRRCTKNTGYQIVEQEKSVRLAIEYIHERHGARFHLNTDHLIKLLVWFKYGIAERLKTQD